MKKSRSGSSKANLFCLLAGVLLTVSSLFGLKNAAKEPEIGRTVYQKIEAQAVKQQKGDKPKSNEFQKVQIDFKRLSKINKDIIGWLLFDQNGISYPVVLGRDNEEYLYQTADKTKNAAGSIFLDALCSADFEDSHTIIYGHNMRDLSMFGKLKQYRLEEGYYEKNRFFTIYTPKKILRYEIFAWYEAPDDDSVYQVGFTADQAFGGFVEKMRQRSLKETGILADQWDKVVTLSTCSGEGRRFLVHGKRISATPYL